METDATAAPGFGRLAADLEGDAGVPRAADDQQRAAVGLGDAQQHLSRAPDRCEGTGRSVVVLPGRLLHDRLLHRDRQRCVGAHRPSVRGPQRGSPQGGGRDDADAVDRRRHHHRGRGLVLSAGAAAPHRHAARRLRPVAVVRAGRLPEPADPVRVPGLHDVRARYGRLANAAAVTHRQHRAHPHLHAGADPWLAGTAAAGRRERRLREHHGEYAGAGLHARLAAAREEPARARHVDRAPHEAGGGVAGRSSCASGSRPACRW